MLRKMQSEVVEFNDLKTLYLKDSDFTKAWKAYKNPITMDRKRWLDFTIQDGMLFKGSQLCIPRSSMRENMIKDKHNGGMPENFG